MYMKSKIVLLGLVLSFMVLVSACKSKQSSYMQVYEAAQKKAVEETEEEEFVEVVKPQNPTTETFQVEKLTSVDGSGIKDYSVVIGSFINKTNADSLKERMINQGYQAMLAQNERGMYRVIVATYDNRTDAVNARDKIKQQYAPDFNDAWLLQQGY